MNYLLDTNVVSEWVKPRPDPGMASWLASIDEDRVFLSVITLTELRQGIERMAPGRRRERLNDWLDDELPDRFVGRILPTDVDVAHEWGRINAASKSSGHSIPLMDACIAATAKVHQLSLVTRNVTDFSTVDIDLVNPWTQ